MKSSSKQWGAVAGLGCLLLGVSIWSACRPGPSADLSPLARSLLREHRRAWVYTETPQFRVYGKSALLRHQVAAEAAWTVQAIDQRLGWAVAPASGVFFVIEQESDWDRILQAAGHRVEGAALHIGREIYLRRTATTDTRWIDIPHELVHFRLWQTYGRQVPLWLEEGLAQFLGWELARAYQRQQGLQLEREQDRLPAEQLWPWDSLFGLTRYPEDPHRLKAFYRQSEALVAQWSRSVPPESWTQGVLQLLESGETLRDTLAKAYDWDEARYESLLHRAENKTLQ